MLGYGRYSQALLAASSCLAAALPQGQGQDPQIFTEQNGGPADAAPPVVAQQSQLGASLAAAPGAGGGTGEWGPLIPFPLIPVAAAIIPGAGGRTTELFTFSSYADFKFGGLGEPPQGKTQSAWYNVETGEIRHSTITETMHDMFCPGLSHDIAGRIFVTGGNNAEVTSIYDFGAAKWIKGPEMNIARGYHASAVTSEGNIFTIGGSFSGGIGGEGNVPLKDGEVFRQATGTWDRLPGAKVQPMLTKDVQGAYRSDNHGHFHTWLDGWIFQAGPSTNMNWYDTKGEGQVVPAGQRTPGFDQMNGMSVMFDVGQILSVGGAQDYGFSDAFNTACIVTIGQPGQQAQVQPTSAMNFRRVFANAAVLPDGSVMVTGGQTYSEPFTNNNATLNAELWEPKTGTWTTLAPEQNARTYHSFSILLPDGRVMTGGGGLCWDKGTCDPAADHPDAQILTPPYLQRGGQRPAIAGMNFPDGADSYFVPVGGAFSATLQGAPAGDVTFSIVRLGSATHSVNTDQRRVPLVPTGMGDGGAYNFQLDNRPGIVSPGFWYFFAMVDGIPSVSRTIQVR